MNNCDAEAGEKQSDNEMHKSMECIGCKHLFDCKGKPREVKHCLNYEERER